MKKRKYLRYIVKPLGDTIEKPYPRFKEVLIFPDFASSPALVKAVNIRVREIAKAIKRNHLQVKHGT